MLTPGVRLVERPGVLHFFDGRRVVSVAGDDDARATVLHVLHDDVDASSDPGGDSPGGSARGDDNYAPVRALLVRLGLIPPPSVAPTHTTAPATGPATAGAPTGASTGAQFAAATDPRTSLATATERLAGTHVHVCSDDDVLLGLLAGSGLRVHRLVGPELIPTLDADRDLLVVTASDDRPAGSIDLVNRLCLDSGVTWLPIGAFDGAVLRVGPLMIPGHTACAACLHRRLAANVAYADLYDDVADVPAAPTPAALRQWAYGIASLVLLRWIATGDHAVPGQLLSLDPLALTVRSALVRRVPRCPVCRAPEHVAAAAPWGFAGDH